MMIDQKTYSFVTAIIFLVIAVLHLLRLILGWHAEIGGWTMPFWLSWAALVVAGYLAYTGFTFNKR